MIKVVQVVPSVDAESSGPSYSVPRLCDGLTANGVQTELHFLDQVPARLRHASYRIENYPRHDAINLGWSPEMLKGLRDACRTADVIHNNSLWMMPNVYPAWAVKGTRCKLVVAPRGTLAAWSLKKGWLKKKIFGGLLQDQVLRRADMFHATSKKEYEEIRELGYKQPVAIVPIGMDLPEVKNTELKTQRAGGLHRVVFFGRLHKVKAVDRLVQAWQLLNQLSNRTIEQWELVIAGPDNGVRGELEAYVAEHEIPRVRFVGEINGLAKYDFLSAADLYVLPSFTENFGVTVAEALACGTPVIVSKGTPWAGVVDHHCGWWVDNAPESLACALREAIDHASDSTTRTVLRDMGEMGREWIRFDFSWEGIGAKMKRAYEWLLAPDEVSRPEWIRI